MHFIFLWTTPKACPNRLDATWVKSVRLLSIEAQEWTIFTLAAMFEHGIRHGGIALCNCQKLRRLIPIHLHLPKYVSSFHLLHIFRMMGWNSSYLSHYWPDWVIYSLKLRSSANWTYWQKHCRNHARVRIFYYCDKIVKFGQLLGE